MLLTYALLAVLFIFGLVGTKLLSNFPTKNKLTTPNAETPKAEKNVTKSRTSNYDQFRDELRSVFATFDKNNDGYITKQELKESLKNIGIAMSDTDVKEVVERVDSNGDGLIDLDEFCGLFESVISKEEVKIEKENGEDEDGGGYLKEAFDVFDGDGDGAITVEELGLVLSSLGFKEGKLLENCEEMIRKVDIDGDGNINFDEFKKMMESGKRLLPLP